jgi:hypothetical protein
MKRNGALLLLALLHLGCGKAGPDAAEVSAAKARAAKAAAALASRLFGELSAALKESTPDRALDVCAVKAQAMTREIAAAEGLSLRRTALRCRNPENAPDPFEEAFLRKEAERVAAGGAPREEPFAEVVDAPGGGKELRFLKTIHVGGICVACHGGEADLSDATRAALAKRYPEDRATGFRLNDFRGAVSVRVPLP